MNKESNTNAGKPAEGEALQAAINTAHKEVERLRKNRTALLDVMSDLLLLVQSDFRIEYMNNSAIQTFGNMVGRACHDALGCVKEECPDCPVEKSLSGQACRGSSERQVGPLYVEYNYVSFQGYNNDHLVMIVMRDISKRKQQEIELAEIHDNIEKVLRQKIKALDESKRVQQELLQEVNILKNELDSHNRYDDNMVGNSRQFRELRQMISQVADSEMSILITGESGTGKELVADTIHRHSRRKGKPFLKFNCAAVSESLLESDLFGYEKGAFTGAAARRQGKFEIADLGTIFLDEIGDISPRMQVALLRVLENGEIIRVGGNESLRVDVRVIAATNVDLAEAVKAHKFRRDLFYRLNVINIHLPPLRERREDIVPLITHFIKKYRVAFKKNIDYLPNRITDRLLRYDWPGNVRELENVIKRGILLSRDNVITEKELSFEGNPVCDDHKSLGSHVEKWMLEQPLKETLAGFEAKVLATAMDRYERNPQNVARVLGLGKTTLYEKLKRYKLLEGNK